MSSGAIASCIANPTDVLKVGSRWLNLASYFIDVVLCCCFVFVWVKVRMQAASSEVYKVKSNVFDSFKQIYHNEGWRGLYRVSGLMAFSVRNMELCVLLFY